MVKIMFVCLGNICRSPMAEYLMKDYLVKAGKQKDFVIASSAISSNEVGNPVYMGTKKILNALNIDCSKKRAVVLNKSDYNKFDYFIGMDESNRNCMIKLFDGDKQKKVFCLLDFTDNPRPVADPWYTGDFEKAYLDISSGLKSFYKFLGI